MMRRPLLSLGLLALLGLHGSAGRLPAQGSGKVAIALLAEAVVDDSLVTLDQIATLSGGSEILRKRMAKLDVAEFRVGVSHMLVTNEQVRFRLLLAGLDASQFLLSGAQRTMIVESDEPATLRKILAAAEQKLRAHYPGDPANLALTPNRGIDIPAVDLRAGERVRFEAKVKAPLPSSGRALVEVALVVGGRTREVVPVYFEITEAESAAQAQPTGKAAIRPALYTAPAAEARPFVKSGDNLKIVAHIGSARIEALGEAMQDGRIGDIIRVRNVESNRTVHGKVEASGRVLVEY